MPILNTLTIRTFLNIMAPRNGNGSTRSSNRKKGNKKEPQTAAHNALQMDSSVPQAHSTPHDQTLPAGEKNKTKRSRGKQNTPSPRNVSDLSFTFVDSNILDKDPSQPGVLQANTDALHMFNEVGTHSASNVDTVSAPHEVSDNRGSQHHSSTSQSESILKGNSSIMEGSPPPPPTPPSFQSPPLNSTPEDPWHNTYNELRIVRARMGTLEKVEAATLDFTKQLQVL